MDTKNKLKLLLEYISNEVDEIEKSKNINNDLVTYHTDRLSLLVDIIADYL